MKYGALCIFMLAYMNGQDIQTNHTFYFRICERNNRTIKVKEYVLIKNCTFLKNLHLEGEGIVDLINVFCPHITRSKTVELYRDTMGYEADNETGPITLSHYNLD